MNREEILKKASQLCAPYNLTAQLHDAGAKSPHRYYVEISGKFPGWDILETLSKELSAIEEVERVLLAI